MNLKKTQELLSQLSEVNEQLISLADDIWLSIDPRDNESVTAGAEFIKNYNEATGELSKAVLSIEQQLSHYFQKNQESIMPAIEQGSDDAHKNQRLVRELDRSKAYSLNDDFTFKRPYGFILNDIAYTQLRTWKAVYLKVLDIFYLNRPSKFLEMVHDTRFISSRGNYLFSEDKDKLRAAQPLEAGFYAEVNMSANQLARAIIQVLEYFSVDENSMKVYLREDRDA